MKFTIEVDDFYLEEGDLEGNLKQYIIRDVVNQITTSLKTKIEDGINREVKSQVEQSLYRKISKLTEELIATDKIKGRYSNDPEQTLQEYVQSMFTSSARDKAPVDEVIKKLANQFGDEMKKRYDLLFASQLVAKLNEGGLLKEDAVKLLLDKN